MGRAADSWPWVARAADRFPLAPQVASRWPWAQLSLAAVVVAAGLVESWVANTWSLASPQTLRVAGTCSRVERAANTCCVASVVASIPPWASSLEVVVAVVASWAPPWVADTWFPA